MTLELVTATTVRWSTPEDGLWVATRQGDFLGMIELNDGRYLASDSRGRPLGSHEDLDDARTAFTTTGMLGLAS